MSRKPNAFEKLQILWRDHVDNFCQRIHVAGIESQNRQNHLLSKTAIRICLTLDWSKVSDETFLSIGLEVVSRLLDLEKIEMEKRKREDPDDSTSHEDYAFSKEPIDPGCLLDLILTGMVFFPSAWSELIRLKSHGQTDEEIAVELRIEQELIRQTWRTIVTWASDALQTNNNAHNPGQIASKDRVFFDLVNLLRNRVVEFGAEYLQLSTERTQTLASNLRQLADLLSEDEQEEIPLEEAAEKLNLRADSLRRYCNNGTLQGVKRGSIWFLSRAEIARYERERGQKGRTKKK